MGAIDMKYLPEYLGVELEIRITFKYFECKEYDMRYEGYLMNHMERSERGGNPGDELLIEIEMWSWRGLVREAWMWNGVKWRLSHSNSDQPRESGL